MDPRIPNQRPGRPFKPKYIVSVTANTNPWIETMKPYITKIIDFDVLGAKTPAVLSAAWAPSTSATYGRTIHRYFDFYDEHMLVVLAATPAHMVRYVAWLGQLGTIIRVLLFFDSLRRIISGRSNHQCLEIDLTLKHEGWTANTLTCSLSEDTIVRHERPPDGFC
jgi:hypothetical protein